MIFFTSLLLFDTPLHLLLSKSFYTGLIRCDILPLSADTLGCAKIVRYVGTNLLCINVSGNTYWPE
jgi:hypothetical protein